MRPTAQFEHQLPLLFADDHAVAQLLTERFLLQNRYHYDKKAQHFKCRSKKKFDFYAENRPEKDFYALLNPGPPKRNLAQYLSESDLVKYYLIYCWAAEFAQQNKWDAAWQASFKTAMQEQICQKSKQYLDNVIRDHQDICSVHKNKLFGFLMKRIAQIPSLAQRVQYYQQLTEQVAQKHFHHDNTKQHVFCKYTEAVTRYEYELLLQELNEAVQPILYYPRSAQQQANLCEYGRHCFFRDRDTKDLKYINSMGTIFTLPDTLLLAKNAHKIQANGNKWMLEYQPLNTPNKRDHFLVDRMHSADFGTAFRVDSSMMHTLVPKGLPEDPIIKHAEKTLKKTKQYYQTLQRGIALFNPDHLLAFQHRMAGLIQVKEMLQNKPTREIRQTKVRPIATDFMGRGRNTYVFFTDPSHSEHTELWHVDRSEDTPVFTQFPMQDEQATRIRNLFDGARSSNVVMLEEDAYKWYQFGRHAQRRNIIDSDSAMLRLAPDVAKRIPELVLSDMPIYQHFTSDWTYYETSNELMDVLENTEKTRDNKRMIARCHTIHQQLNLIEQDRLKVFPDSRGIVPPDKRQEIMRMMIALVKDKNSAEAQHYFRTKHRVYHVALQADQSLDEYEPSSFVWDDHQTLWYLDEHRHKKEVLMTDSIRRKLQDIAAKAGENAQYISANDVFELMTRPRLFYYYCNIPVCLDLRWFDYSYFIPLQFDRSKGLHTGTAQEMLRAIHEHKLSASVLLYKFGEVLIMEVIPIILAQLGIMDFPYYLFSKIESAIIFWVFLVWNVQYTYEYIRFTLLMNDLVHPELNQLDNMLQELNNDVSKLHDLEQGLVPEDSGVDDLPSPVAYLSYLK
ncbi:MAG: hypothetical protein NTU48_03995 [Legionellales bacterium]|nr:hypothetical protein [Legionellales bacterium]